MLEPPAYLLPGGNNTDPHGYSLDSLIRDSSSSSGILIRNIQHGLRKYAMKLNT